MSGKNQKNKNHINGDIEKSFEILFNILPSISRSFSYIILKTSNPEIRKALCTSYILFRIADTIEDSTGDYDTKKQLFSRLKSLLKAGDCDNSNISAFPLKFKDLKDINEKERFLIENIYHALNGYYSISQDIRTAIYKWITEMIHGMEVYLNKQIQTFDDLDEYCYYVAGTVGFLLSDIFWYYDLLKKEPKQLKKSVLGFALSLQKVNILRDIYEDIHLERLFWPKSLYESYGKGLKELNNKEKNIIIQKMLKNIIPDIKKGHDYVYLLSKRDKTIRFFCCFSIILALKTLILINQKPLVFDKQIKVSKFGFYHTLLLSHLCSRSNSYYKICIQKYLKRLKF